MNNEFGKKVTYLANQHRAYVNYLFKKDNLIYTEGNILMILNKRDGLNQEQLRKALLIDKAFVSRLVHQLEEKELILKKVSDEDKRNSYWYISESGKEKISRIKKLLEVSSKRLSEGIEEEELLYVMKVLDKMCDNVSKKGDYYGS